MKVTRFEAALLSIGAIMGILLLIDLYILLFCKVRWP